MAAIRKNNYFILTGAAGTGKTALLQRIQAHGFNVVGEAARHILTSQLSTDGPGLPSKNPLLFLQMMLQHSISGYDDSKATNGFIFFDRGIPDVLAYAVRFKVDLREFHLAADQYLYSRSVFVLPPWKEIYVNDEVRKMPYSAAVKFHDLIVSTYQSLGCDLIQVPHENIDTRAEFILSSTK